MKKQWKGLSKLEDRCAAYMDSTTDEKAATVEARNTAQHKLHAAFQPFFTTLHADLKALDKTLRHLEKQQVDAAQARGKRGSTERNTKVLKAGLETLHTEVK